MSPDDLIFAIILIVVGWAIIDKLLSVVFGSKKKEVKPKGSKKTLKTTENKNKKNSLIKTTKIATPSLNLETISRSNFIKRYSSPNAVEEIDETFQLGENLALKKVIEIKSKHEKEEISIDEILSITTKQEAYFILLCAHQKSLAWQSSGIKLMGLTGGAMATINEMENSDLSEMIFLFEKKDRKDLLGLLKKKFGDELDEIIKQEATTMRQNDRILERISIFERIND
tara:strand:+ start:267 stop:950 length:684 start_codon:yes stop_codon:yes gene_type:complete